MHHLHGPAGTCAPHAGPSGDFFCAALPYDLKKKVDVLRRVALFSSATLHTVNTRPTTATRKTLQVYYGHASRPAMSHDYDSLMPPQFFRCVSWSLPTLLVSWSLGLCECVNLMRAVRRRLNPPAPVGPQ